MVVNIVSLLFRGARGLVVEVDVTSPAPQWHHTSLSPRSPVSILHNSPFYSPAVTPASPRSPGSPLTNQPFMEEIIGNVCSDDQADVESSNGDFVQDINDSDEGIESEDGEDIDGEAFKRLIRSAWTDWELWETLSYNCRENVPEQNLFTKPTLVYSNCFIREEINGGKVKLLFQ